MKPKTKSTIKNVLLIILAVCFILSLKECSRRGDSISELNAEVLFGKNETKRWVDAAGDSHITIKKLIVEKETAEKLFKEEAKKSKIKEKHLLSVIKANSKTTIVIPDFDTLYQDTGYVRVQKVHDTLKIDLWDSLTFNQFTKRKGIFGLGRKEYYLDFYNKNKYVHYPDIHAVEVKQEKYTIGISPYVGYDVIWNRLSAGICITPEFLKIRL